MPSMLIISAVGIAFLVMMTWVLGGMKEATFGQPEEVLDRFRQDFYGFSASEIKISDNGGHAALLQSADKAQIGLCFAMGDSFATRLLRAGDIAALQQDGNTVTFKLNEFTGRKVSLQFDDQDQTQSWLDRLTPLSA